MGLADAIKAATAVVPNTILPSLASSTITVQRRVTQRGADNATKQTYAATGIRADVSIQQLAGGRAQYVWGDESNAIAEMTVPLTLDIREQDAVDVVAGDFAGKRYFVEQAVPQPLGGVIHVALAETARAV